MKTALPLFALLVLSGCASTSGGAPEPQLHHTTSVKCVASNVKQSGCKTEYELAIAVLLGTGTVPSADDLRVPDAGKSEF
ncbi:MAG TPA: hypothetical protein VNS12_11155 [Pelagibacterium sp.]|uniref:hypothetical protein n=1 Tax=Pelagibacterium sp. TaxID=1967288 RepID=UPI002CCE5810|nr:hypothetical protein [Pelagibacterium sp.]HWJ88619.1 hypothetical protein [Pelagibacterium sp.]